ncbi:hypothetical protein SAMN04488051_102132 [Alkalimonas amylolytica]|uniref:Uncharacterized protein n=1 Tax=Alkalimonas amylolytica TaxID=152573 RepID=A0A1H3ZD34_ALKAM|nr:hypothetical protein SAMN04488051_102132 [Alkalimonas amylolytica]
MLSKPTYYGYSIAAVACSSPFCLLLKQQIIVMVVIVAANFTFT